MKVLQLETSKQMSAASSTDGIINQIIRSVDLITSLNP